jgi:hypothetical protein
MSGYASCCKPFYKNTHCRHILFSRQRHNCDTNPAAATEFPTPGKPASVLAVQIVYIYRMAQLFIVAFAAATLFLRTQRHQDTLEDGRPYLGAILGQRSRLVSTSPPLYLACWCATLLGVARSVQFGKIWCLSSAGLLFYSVYFMMASAWSELSITVRPLFILKDSACVACLLVFPTMPALQRQRHTSEHQASASHCL